jgi:argonaute-like protein implicated in RNA metabolism and viral defense
MIKLINLLELQVTNPNPTAKEVESYWQNEINNKTTVDDILWKEYIKMRKPYVEKYIPNNLFSSVPELVNSVRLIPLLSQSDLNKFYREMKQLVQKYA